MKVKIENGIFMIERGTMPKDIPGFLREFAKKKGIDWAEIEIIFTIHAEEGRLWKKEKGRKGIAAYG